LLRASFSGISDSELIEKDLEMLAQEINLTDGWFPGASIVPLP